MVKLKSPLFSADAVGRIAARPPISSSFRNRLRRADDPYPAPTPPVPPPDQLNVAGTLNPDATGTYTEGALVNGRPSYSRADNAWHIWWEDTSNPPWKYWRLTSILGTYTLPGWATGSLTTDPPTGDYAPLRYTTGTATVTEI